MRGNPSFIVPLRFPEQRSSRGEKCLAEYHRRNSQRPQQRLPIVKSLRTSPNVTCEEALMIEGYLAIAVEPLRKAADCRLHLGNLSFVHDAGVLKKQRNTYSGRTLNLSIGLNVRRDFRTTESFCICSLRWNAMSCSETGLLTRRTIAQPYPSPRASPSTI